MALPANLANGDLINETWVDAVVDTITPTAWTAVTFQNGWSNLVGLCQYRKVGDMVQVRGIIKGGTSGSVAFTMPVGFRPPQTVRFPISSALGDASGLPSATVSGIDGTVTLSNTSNTGNTAVDGVQFSTVA